MEIKRTESELKDVLNEQFALYYETHPQPPNTLLRVCAASLVISWLPSYLLGSIPLYSVTLLATAGIATFSLCRTTSFDPQADLKRWKGSPNQRFLSELTRSYADTNHDDPRTLKVLPLLHLWADDILTGSDPQKIQYASIRFCKVHYWISISNSNYQAVRTNQSGDTP